MLATLKKTPTALIYNETRTLFSLTWPMLIAQCLQVCAGSFDIFIAGQVSTHQVEALSIGSAVFALVFVTSIGIGSSINPILSQEYGKKGLSHSIGNIGRQALWFSILVGIVGLLLLFFSESLLRQYLHTPISVTEQSIAFIHSIALGMPPFMFFYGLCSYTSSLLRPKPIMIVNFLGFMLNILLDCIFAQGLFGFSPMGATGCGWARCIAYSFDCIAMVIYIICHADYHPFGLFSRFSFPHFSTIFTFVRIGFFSGVSYFLEVSLIAALILIADPFGSLYFAIQSIIINCGGLIFMIPQSFSVALSIRISENMGANKHEYARFICGLGMLIGCVMALLSSLFMALARYPIMDLYSDDPAIIAIGSTVLLVACVFQIVRTTQMIISGALRGYKKTVIPMFIHILGLGVFFICCLVLSLPSGFFGFTFPLGIYGAWIGAIMGFSMASLFLWYYLSIVSRQAIPLSRLTQALGIYILNGTSRLSLTILLV